MAKIITDNKHYTDIAAAIREKNGGAETYKPEEMAAAVLAIETEKEIILEDVYIEPTEEEQTVYPSDGYDGIGSVTVGAAEGGGGGMSIPAEYVSYVETAKTIYTGDYSDIAIAENENYISVLFLTDSFSVETFDASTTSYTAIGVVFVTCAKATGEWDSGVDHTTTVSTGDRFIEHWVYCSRYVEYEGVTLFPVGISTFIQNTAIDYSSYSAGTFKETLETGQTVTYTLTLDSAGKPTTITDANGNAVTVSWG